MDLKREFQDAYLRLGGKKYSPVGYVAMFGVTWELPIRVLQVKAHKLLRRYISSNAILPTRLICKVSQI